MTTAKDLNSSDDEGSESKDVDNEHSNDVDGYATLYLETMCMMLEQYDMQHQRKNPHLNQKTSTKKEGGRQSVDYHQPSNADGHGDDNHQSTHEKKNNEDSINILKVDDWDIQNYKNDTEHNDDTADEAKEDDGNLHEKGNESDDDNKDDIGDDEDDDDYYADNEDSTEDCNNAAEIHDIENYAVEGVEGYKRIHSDKNPDVQIVEHDADSFYFDEGDANFEFITVHADTDTTTTTEDISPDDDNVGNAKNNSVKTNDMGILNEMFANKQNNFHADINSSSNIDVAHIASIDTVSSNAANGNIKTREAVMAIGPKAETDVQTTLLPITKATSTSSDDNLQLLMAKSINNEQVNASFATEGYHNATASDANEMNLKYELYENKNNSNIKHNSSGMDVDIEIIALEQLLPIGNYQNYTKELQQTNKTAGKMEKSENMKLLNTKRTPPTSVMSHKILPTTLSKHVIFPKRAKISNETAKYDSHYNIIYDAQHKLLHNSVHVEPNEISNLTQSVHITPNTSSFRNLTRFSQILSNANSSLVDFEFYDNYHIPLGYLRWRCKRLPITSRNKSGNIFEIFADYADVNITGILIDMYL